MFLCVNCHRLFFVYSICCLLLCYYYSCCCNRQFYLKLLGWGSNRSNLEPKPSLAILHLSLSWGSLGARKVPRLPSLYSQRGPTNLPFRAKSALLLRWAFQAHLKHFREQDQSIWPILCQCVSSVFSCWNFNTIKRMLSLYYIRIVQLFHISSSLDSRCLPISKLVLTK